MQGKSAAPGARDSGPAGTSAGDPTFIPLPPGGLPPAIIERLAGAGIRNCSDWLNLSRAERHSIFGITKAMVATVDNAITGKIEAPR
jgi:hypothetical protein